MTIDLSKKNVVFVDDEEFILRSLKRLLKREAYQVHFFNTAKDVLEYLKDHPVDLVISDIRMPITDGYELLSTVKKEYPKILRVALSGYTETKMIYNLIEKNIAKLFIFKPWDAADLKHTIQTMLEFEETLSSSNVLEIINNLDSLPSLPDMYVKISNLMDQEADIEAISKLVSEDQAIALKVLKLANSAFYGRKTGDLNQAIMGIGLTNLKNIVLSNAMFDGPESVLKELENIWEQSVLTNRYIQLIYSDILKKKNPSIYGAIGLLHDLGKALFLLYFEEKYKNILNNRSDESDIIDIDVLGGERDLFNITHQELGAYLLDWWQLPFSYVEAAYYHHNPSNPNVINSELVYVVHLANYYARKSLYPDLIEAYLDARAFSVLDISREVVEKILLDNQQE